MSGARCQSPAGLPRSSPDCFTERGVNGGTGGRKDIEPVGCPP